MKRVKKSGFTLLELLVVVIIVGILATFAIPQFQAAVDRSREAEATSAIAAGLTAQFAFFQERSRFTDGSTAVATGGDLLAVLPIMRWWAFPGASPNFDWTLGSCASHTGVAVGATNTCITATSANHGHPTAQHEIQGIVDSTGQRVVEVTRNTSTSWSRI